MRKQKITEEKENYKYAFSAVDRLTVETNASSKYVNRELSLVSFNERVLAMCQNRKTPLLERLKYLCIVSSNLDELFEIRVAGFKAQMLSNSHNNKTPDGLTVKNTFLAVKNRTQKLVKLQYDFLNKHLLPNLTKQEIFLLPYKSLNSVQKKWATSFFRKEVLPILTPIGLDPAHPFPRVLNKSLNFIIEMVGKDSYGRTGRIAILQAPRALPRVIPLPKKITDNKSYFLLLSSFIEEHFADIFPGMQVKGIYQFRVTRNSDLFVDEEEVTDIRQALRGELSQRNYGDAVRLEVSQSISAICLNLLKREFDLTDDDCYKVNGPVNLVRLNQLYDLIDKPLLKFKVFTPSYPKLLSNTKCIFQNIKSQDVLLHHPYECFDVVANFIKTAAEDSSVVAISQTIYRTGSTSELMQHLITAAKKGKEVTAIVELMARFDEETNISWASKLEETGAHVVFGVVGNKTHAKMCLVVRKEKSGLKRYCHLGTGNYHPKTTRAYTDFGLLTADPKICSEVHEVFHQLTGLGKAKPLKYLWQSPFNLHSNVIKAINREIKHAKLGRKAKIIARMNSLVEIKTINALYNASKAGVSIDLLVRGVCMLRPGVPGLSENIRVRSTIGRFLEHSRIYFFKNDGNDDLLLSSADWMDRNFFRRVEIAFPVRDERLKKRVLYEGLKVHFLDNTLAWTMKSDGSYQIRRNLGDNNFASQEKLLEKFGE
tara:strand:+ start:12979 stop:15114 length:2136 start_codon:yes stop_codon:yes gene_type:complete